jgi:DNA-binding MarR family transcriptional regulator
VPYGVPPYQLSIASELTSRAFSRTYDRRFGIDIPEWRVVAVLGENSPQTTRDVIARTAMDRVRVSRAVIKLADKKLIIREAAAHDQQAQMLSLSRRGALLYQHLVPLARSMQRKLVSFPTSEEAVILDRLLLQLQSGALALEASAD